MVLLNNLKSLAKLRSSYYGLSFLNYNLILGYFVLIYHRYSENVFKIVFEMHHTQAMFLFLGM